MAVFRDESGRRAKLVRGLIGLGLLLLAGWSALFAREVLRGWPQEAPAVNAAPRAASLAPAPASVRARPQDDRAPVLAAFVAAGDPQSVAALARQAPLLTHALPDLVRIEEDGALSAADDRPLRAAAPQLELVPTVVNLGPEGFSRARALTVLGTAQAREATARRLRALCLERGWAGVNLDLEALAPEDGPLLAALVEEVAAALGPLGLLTTVDVPADPDGLPAARLGAAADLVLPMAYDEHASTDPAGPIATPAGARRAALRWLAHVPREKLVLAVGAYALAWPLDGGPARPHTFTEALELARDAGVPVRWDPGSAEASFRTAGDAGAEVHLLDAPATAAQLSATDDLGLRGAAVWRLGSEDPQLWELFAPAPRPRRFDPARARLVLEGERPLGPARDDVRFVGEGELFRLRSAPSLGRRSATFAADGTLARVDYAELPGGTVLERSGGPSAGRVALSFDDGPDPAWTPRVLDLLRERGLHAAFFVVGSAARAHPELVRRALDEGHLVGNHTFTHPDLSESSELRLGVELGLVQRLLAGELGGAPRLFRPPFHADRSLDEPARAAVLAQAARRGLWTLGQDVDAEDWRGHDARAIAALALARAAERGGGMVLLHDGGGDRSATVAALPLLLDGLAARGLRAVDARELAGLPPGEALLSPPEGDPAGSALLFRGWDLAARAAAALAGAALLLLALRAVALVAAALLHARRPRRRAPRAPWRVSALVPAYNEEKGVCRTVDSLLAQEPPLLEVICIDDGSTDRTLEVLRARFAGHPRVRILSQPNGGKASALNRGFAAAQGALVVALDGDTLFAPGAVAALVAPFSDPRVAAVAGNAKVGNRVCALARWQALEYVAAQNLEKRAWDLLGAVPVVPGAVGCWRRDAVRAAGGFLRDTLAEDTDLTLRLIAGGHRVVYAEDAVAWTEAPEDAHALLKQRVRWTFGVLQAAWKQRRHLCRPGSGPLGWLLLPSVVLLQVAVPLAAPLADLLALAAALRGEGGAALAAWGLFLGVELALCALAVALEGEDPRLLWGVPAQRVVVRAILWLALWRALRAAVAGSPVGWGKLARTGNVRVAPSGGERLRAAPA